MSGDAYCTASSVKAGRRVVKEVGLELLAKTALPRASSLCQRSAKSLLVSCLAKVRGCKELGSEVSQCGSKRSVRVRIEGHRVKDVALRKGHEKRKV